MNSRNPKFKVGEFLRCQLCMDRLAPGRKCIFLVVDVTTQENSSNELGYRVLPMTGMPECFSGQKTQQQVGNWVNLCFAEYRWGRLAEGREGGDPPMMIEKAKPGDFVRCNYCRSGTAKRCLFLVIDDTKCKSKSDYTTTGRTYWNILPLTSDAIACSFTKRNGSLQNAMIIERNSNFERANVGDLP
jgi:hypothetical protein